MASESLFEDIDKHLKGKSEPEPKADLDSRTSLLGIALCLGIMTMPRDRKEEKTDAERSEGVKKMVAHFEGLMRDFGFEIVETAKGQA